VPPEPSTLHRLAEKALGRPPGEWIHERRAAGLTLREVAAELDAFTGVDDFVSYEAIRSWHATWREVVDRLEAEVGGAA
jgi:hypothetical protein